MWPSKSQDSCSPSYFKNQAPQNSRALINLFIIYYLLLLLLGEVAKFLFIVCWLVWPLFSVCFWLFFLFETLLFCFLCCWEHNWVAPSKCSDLLHPSPVPFCSSISLHGIAGNRKAAFIFLRFPKWTSDSGLVAGFGPLRSRFASWVFPP